MNRILIYLLMTMGSVIYAQDNIANTVDVTVTCIPARIKIGDVFHVTVQVKHPDNVSVFFQTFDAVLKKFSRHKFETHEQKEKNYSIHYFEYDLTSFEIGQHKIGPFPLEYEVDGKKEKQESNVISIFVESVLDLTASNLGPKSDPEPLTMTRSWVSRIILLILLMTILFGLVFSYLKWKNGHTSIQLPVIVQDPRPADEIALDHLEKLKHSGLIQAGSFYQLYVEMSTIYRNFISQRYHCDTLDQTTKETLQTLKAKEERVSVRQKVAELLEIFDLFKFAKYKPQVDEPLKQIQSTADSIREMAQRLE